MGLHNSLAIPWGSSGGKASLPLALLAVAPVVLPAAYVAYVLRQGARRTTVSTSITPPDPLIGKASKARGDDERGEKGAVDALAIPPDVLAELDNYVIARERIVSEAVPLENIRPGLLPGRDEADGDGDGKGAQGLLETYLATTMRAFTWTPQAFVIRAMVARLPDGAAHADTFSTAYLGACAFAVGDRVCGVYRVRERVSAGEGERERVFLDLSPPAGWKGPVVCGVLDCGYVLEKGKGKGKGDRNGCCVRFVNETVLWRRKGGKPTLLEGAVSRWLHALMVGWMMVGGVEAVTCRTKAKTT
ncbi:hypothetical protein F4859DRAFT_482161 [Xylaria cf. heliscus]|nr:hypothetical protein F4859DRAFT_482161 [Xylaria cf. heliscus]